MTQIAPGAPKIKCLIPKIRPPPLSLNETNNSKENIQIKANENNNYLEPKLPNKVYTILDVYKEKYELIFFPKIYNGNNRYAHSNFCSYMDSTIRYT